MKILGLGGSNHDFSACVVDNEVVIGMIEEERITRKKHGVGLNISLAQGFSRKYCERNFGCKISEFDAIASNDIINPAMLFRLEKVNKINHHLTHAASAYYCSTFHESAILTVDSVGSTWLNEGVIYYESAMYSYGHQKKIEVLERNGGINVRGTDYIENSLGIFYSTITEVIGFGEFEEGKTMGLAPYGTNRLYKELCKYISYGGNGKVVMTTDNILNLLSHKAIISGIANERERRLVMADYAWAAQRILEEMIMLMCEHLYKITHSKNLCLAGGIALNSVANYKLYKRNIFQNIFIQPAAGDNGTSIGAALYCYHNIMNP